MDIKKILSCVDHTVLKQDATWEQVKALCDDAVKYETATVCIPNSYVKMAKEYVGDKMKIACCIGFPNGYSTTAVKVFEARDAVANGADEGDMVLNVGWLKDKRYDEIVDEIKAVKQAMDGRVLKVIIEACLLTEQEKIKMCELVTEAGADYIKTSTGFSSGGATYEDVALMAKHIGSNVKIKAAGGIKTLEQAEKFIELGASRLGTSSVVSAVKAAEK